jgi:hypothetical protein
MGVRKITSRAFKYVFEAVQLVVRMGGLKDEQAISYEVAVVRVKAQKEFVAVFAI